MKTIEEMILDFVSLGMTFTQAQNYACQKIVLQKIAKSSFVDKVLLKGGIVMFNETNNIRRATADLDFDFIRYDISDKSIGTFINLLNRNYPQYKIKITKIEQLHQDDYEGKRVFTIIEDKTASLKFKLDIGVHTLFAIDQQNACFSFDDDSFVLKVNPPEQVFSEKLYSLAKHGVLSTRFKDIFDMYYFIKNNVLNKKTVLKCLSLLTDNTSYNINTTDDVIDRVTSVLVSNQFVSNIKNAKDKWLDDDIATILQTITDYLYSL